jgi:hypothetical protein
MCMYVYLCVCVCVCVCMYVCACMCVCVCVCVCVCAGKVSSRTHSLHLVYDEEQIIPLATALSRSSRTHHTSFTELYTASDVHPRTYSGRLLGGGGLLWRAVGGWLLRGLAGKGTGAKEAR